MDLNCVVNLGSYIQKRVQLTDMFIQTQKDLNQLAELNEILRLDLNQEMSELEHSLEILKEKVRLKWGSSTSTG